MHSKKQPHRWLIEFSIQSDTQTQNHFYIINAAKTILLTVKGRQIL